jgi:serine protease AprX
MRYSVISKGLTLLEVERECRRVGATNIKPLPAMKQVFCELDDEQARRLAAVPGLKVKPVQKVATDRIAPAPYPSLPLPQQLDGLAGGLNLYDTFNDLRQAYSPPLIGSGLTVAVLDSGIRETHEALEDRVVYRANFSESETTADVFGHGTAVAYVIAGAFGQRSGVAPGASLMSLKALNDDGKGTDEMIVEAIDRVCRLVEEAREQGLPLTDPMYPNTINISLGAEDDGDPDNPMRVACRTAVDEYGLQVIAAAGNQGPKLTTVMSPACDPKVIAVGGIRTWEFEVWERSSRGPTVEGVIKPDFVCWAESIEVASNKGDSEYILASGTSFAAPTLTGVDGLLWDLARRVYGQEVRVTYYDWLPYAYAYCVKPEGAPVAKDNSYGYGLPAVGVMVGRLMRPAMPVTTMMETMLPVMMMVGMMGVMIRGV